MAFATRAEVPDGQISVAVHGTPNGYAPGVTTSDVAAAVRKHPDYAPGQPICLYSCYAGSNGTAAELADELGGTVWAPTTNVNLDPGSAQTYLDPGGEWLPLP